MANLYIARRLGHNPAVDAVTKQGFDISIEESEMSDNLCNVYAVSPNAWRIVKSIFGTDAFQVWEHPALSHVQLAMSADEAEGRLRKALR